MALLDTKKKKYIAGGFFLGGIVAGCVLLVTHWEYIVRFQRFGYLGLFLITLTSGFSIPLPVPYMLFIFTLGGVLHPLLVGTVAGAGLGVGGSLLYLTARGGRRFLPTFGLNIAEPSGAAASSRWDRFLRKIKLPRIIEFAHRRGTVAVFVLSVIPNPFFVPMAISLGTMRFRFARFIVACWGGQTVKAIIIAYAGYLGLGSFLRWLGVFGLA